jgi:hypothetical protein
MQLRQLRRAHILPRFDNGETWQSSTAPAPTGFPHPGPLDLVDPDDQHAAVPRPPISV